MTVLPASRPESTVPRRRVDPVIVAVSAIFGLFLAVNGAMLWLTLRQPPQLVHAAYYADAEGYDRIGAESASSPSARQQGWHVEWLPAGSASGVALRVLDGAGKAVGGLGGAIAAYRPSDEALDQSLPLREDPPGSGTYRAEFASPRRGLWKLTVDLRRGADRLHRVMEWVAP